MATIGQTLADARTRLGLSHRRLSETTRIPETVLRAMEHDDFAACGTPDRARRHLRTLCAALRLDAAPLLHRLDTAPPPAPQQPHDTAPAPGHAPHRGQRGWTAVVAAAALTLAVLALPGRDAATDPAATHHAATTTPGHDAPTPTSRSADPTTPPDDRVTLHVTAHRRTWIAVTDATGANLFTGVLAPGQTRDWAAPREIHLRLDDAGNVRLRVNGQDHGTPGAAGEIAHLTYTPDTGPPD